MTRPRILCVDDSKALRMGMKNLLQAKFDVVGAGDGVEALKILVQKKGACTVLLAISVYSVFFSPLAYTSTFLGS